MIGTTLEKDYQGGIQQEGCLGGWMENTTGSTGKGWREIGDSRRWKNMKLEGGVKED